MEIVGNLICMGKFSWSAHGQPTPLLSKLPTSYLEFVSCPLSCQTSYALFQYMEVHVVGSLICMAKIPRTAHGQPTLLPTCSPWTAKWAGPLFFCTDDLGKWTIYSNKHVNPVQRKVNKRINATITMPLILLPFKQAQSVSETSLALLMPYHQTQTI